MLRDAGAAEVHLRISSPPFRWPCFYGIDTPTGRPARRHLSLEAIAEFLDVDSIAYISLKNLKRAIDAPGAGFCDACLTGDYPVAVPVALRSPKAATVGAVATPADVDEAVGLQPRCRGLGLGRDGGNRPKGGATYAGAGVDIDAGDEVVARIASTVATTHRPACSGHWGFGGLFALDPGRFREPVLVASTTGWAPSCWWLPPPAATAPSASTRRHVRRRSRLRGAEPLFLLDYIATARVDRPPSPPSSKGRGGLPQAGCALLAARRPSTRLRHGARHRRLAVGVAERDSLLGPERVRDGDVLVALPSPGLRSNGYTLARHVLLDRAELPLNGPAWDGAPHTLADELLKPSVLYAPAVLAAMAIAPAPSTPRAHHRWRPGGEPRPGAAADERRLGGNGLMGGAAHLPRDRPLWRRGARGDGAGLQSRCRDGAHRREHRRRDRPLAAP